MESSPTRMSGSTRWRSAPRPWSSTRSDVERQRRLRVQAAGLPPCRHFDAALAWSGVDGAGSAVVDGSPVAEGTLVAVIVAESHDVAFLAGRLARGALGSVELAAVTGATALDPFAHPAGMQLLLVACAADALLRHFRRVLRLPSRGAPMAGRAPPGRYLLLCVPHLVAGAALLEAWARRLAQVVLLGSRVTPAARHLAVVLLR